MALQSVCPYKSQTNVEPLFKAKACLVCACVVLLLLLDGDLCRAIKLIPQVLGAGHAWRIDQLTLE